MNCQQVDKLLYLYCDNQVQPHLRADIREHLLNCPACRNNLVMAEMENEALRYTGDIPSLSADFCKRVMLQIEREFGGGTAARPRNRLQVLKRFFSRGSNLAVAGGITAAVLLCLVLASPIQLPGPGHKVTVSDTKAPQEPLPAGSGKNKPNLAGNREMESTLSGSTPNYQDSPPARNPSAGSSTPQTAWEAPRYSRPEAGITSYNRGTAGKTELRKTAITETPFIPQPTYLPAGYALARVENGLDDVLILTYEGISGSIAVKVTPKGGDNSSATTAVTLADQLPRTRATDESLGGAATAQKVMGLGGEPEVSSPETSPAFATITWNVNARGKIYEVQVTGTLPPEELARIAASCK